LLGSLTSPAAFALAAAVTFALTPAAIAASRRIGFLDVPVGYKSHGFPIPYLGGAALFAGFLVGTLSLDDQLSRFAPLLGGASALFVIGTLDDRFAVAPRWRVAAEVGAAIALSATGHGWTVFGSDVPDLLLTVAWIVGLVNAFNLMDNLDGAVSSVAAVAAAGIGTVALLHGDAALGALAFAIAGACAGFLPHNLARPARSFLGDGGSMPLGFLLAAAAIGAAEHEPLGWTAVLVGALLVGLMILDTTLVVISRRRAGVPVVTAGLDHLTHRLLTWQGSPRRVAVVLALLQSALCVLAIGSEELGRIPLVVCSVLVLAAGAAIIALLESPPWRPERPSLMSAKLKVPGPEYETAPPSLDPG
jgi:UDP-GlcNAc:undecaprenyl-phosphate/decaprenyl-phosphate GlcNAc-1-phosphate transferase